MEYGEAPARERRRDVTASAQSRDPDDALSSADHSKTSKELYTMEPSSQPLNLQLKYRPVKDVFCESCFTEMERTSENVYEKCDT